MTTFSNQSNDKIHVDNIPRGSAKMDPYTKSAMSIDAAKQVEKTIGVFFPEDLKLYDLYLKQRLNESVNKEIARQFRKDGKRK